MSQISRFTRARQLTSTVLPGRGRMATRSWWPGGCAR